MFEISKCSRCGKPITPDNRARFTEYGGKVYCGECISAVKEAGKGGDAVDMDALFDVLRSTSFIQRRGDRKYAAAKDLKEMIDIFERSLSRRGTAWKVLLGCLVLGCAAVLYVFSMPGGPREERKEAGGGKGASSPAEEAAGKHGRETAGEARPGERPGGEEPEKRIEARLAALQRCYEKGEEDLSALRKIVAENVGKDPEGRFAALLARIDKDLDEKARAAYARLSAEAAERMKNIDFREAFRAVESFRRKFGGCRWLRGEGAEKLKRLEERVRKEWAAYVRSLAATAGEFERKKDFVNAYATYEAILLVCPPADEPRFRAKMKDLAARARDSYGGKGIGGELKWRRYLEFRREFLRYVKEGDIASLKRMADEYLASREYALIRSEIREDAGDVKFVEEVFTAADRFFRRYVGRQYTLPTREGPVEGIIRKVDRGGVTVLIANEEIPVPFSQVRIEEVLRGRKTGTFHVGMGIIFLAEGDVKKAEEQFGKARALGVSTERYARHIKAFLEAHSAGREGGGSARLPLSRENGRPGRVRFVLPERVYPFYA